MNTIIINKWANQKIMDISLIKNIQIITFIYIDRYIIIENI